MCFFNLLVFDLTIFAIEDRIEMTECSVNTTVFLVAQTDRQTDRQTGSKTDTHKSLYQQTNVDLDLGPQRQVNIQQVGNQCWNAGSWAYRIALASTLPELLPIIGSLGRWIALKNIPNKSSF